MRNLFVPLAAIAVSSIVVLDVQPASAVLVVKTLAEFNEIVSENPRVVVDFTASWCGPCRLIDPKFAELEKEYPNITFIKVDVDENSDTAEQLGVSAMPTFVAIRDGERVSEVVGASESRLRSMLDELAAD